MPEPTTSLLAHTLAKWQALDEDRRKVAAVEASPVETQLRQLAGRLAGEVCGRAVEDVEALESYVRRLGRALAYHAQRHPQGDGRRLDALIERLERGDLGDGKTGPNLLREVALAQALELGEQLAALRFEADYMPAVRAAARRVAGSQAVDEVENFAAELILPREGRPPRIAQYQGRTFLAHWLRAVAVNHCLTGLRKRVVSLPLVALSTGGSIEIAPTERAGCEQLLSGLLSRAVGQLPAEDRLLIKMLLVDNVPQLRLAQSLRIHSGTLTRRRQRIVRGLLERVSELASQEAAARRVEQCLELLLASEDRQMRQQVGGHLAQSLAVEGEAAP